MEHEEYEVVWVEDEELVLNGRQQDWALFKPRGSAAVFLYLRQGARTMSDEDVAGVLKAAWAGYRAMRDGRSQLRAV